MTRLAFFTLGSLLLAGCATYAPRPLDPTPALLSPPEAAVLAHDTASLDRPYLHPVTVDLAQPLDANALAAIAVIANPDLKAQRLRAGVADAQAFAARLIPDPSFSIGADKVLSGPDPLLNITGALALDLNALRTRAVVRAQADAQKRQVRLDLAWAEWQTAGQARLQAARIGALEHAVALGMASDAFARSLLDRTLQAAGRGDVAGPAVESARAAAFDAAGRLRVARHDLDIARLELVRLLGLPPGTALTLAPARMPAPIPAADALFAFAGTHRADLQALRAGYDAQEAAVHKAVLDQFPALNLTVNGNRDSSGNKTAGPAVDFTLPLWNRNRGGIAVEQATRTALKAEYDARLFQTRAEIAAAVHGIDVARALRSALLAGLPGLDRFVQANRAAAARGDLSLAAAEATGQALRDKQLQLVQAEQDIREQTIALELLTGAPQEAWGEKPGMRDSGVQGAIAQ